MRHFGCSQTPERGVGHWEKTTTFVQKTYFPNPIFPMLGFVHTSRPPMEKQGAEQMEKFVNFVLPSIPKNR